MITKVYAVYDSKSEAYMTPMFFRARGEAIRSFAAAAAEEKHDFCRFSADYNLFELGEFNDSDAGFKLHSSPINLGSALELKAVPTTA